jgi:PRC-barrel domain
MAAFDPGTLDRWRALAIVDREGTTVGTIGEFYLDRETGQPTWALVNTGLFGQTQTFVPLVHATEISDGLQVPYEKDHIKNTPKVDLHDELSPEEEAALFAHYGVEYELSAEASAHDSSTVEGDEGPGPVRADPGIATQTGPEAQATAQAGSRSAEPSAVTGPEPTPDGTGEQVPDEPGTAGPDEIPRADSDRSGTSHAASQPPGHDPDLARTAPVEPGLPGSTAASPYGPTPTVGKGAQPADASAEEPPVVLEEPGWAPGSGSFEDQEPFHQSERSSDRWREAKLAAERERIAREAAQPDERSPLERARRRLERLVGGGQDHHDDPAADRDAAERARRARLGMDDDEYRGR